MSEINYSVLTLEQAKRLKTFYKPKNFIEHDMDLKCGLSDFAILQGGRVSTTTYGGMIVL